MTLRSGPIAADPAATAGPVPAASILEARDGLAGVAIVTPLVPVEAAGATVFIKCEQDQPVGAFKARGAWTALRRLPAAERSRGVVTHSSGNHGRAVAWAARRLGIPAVVVMPADAPAVKIAGVRGEGAEIVFVTDRAERQPTCERVAAERGMTIVPPYESLDVIAGQATCGLEVLEQCPDVELILAPVGGGGLVAGIASAVAAFRPGVRVVGVEPAGAPKLSAALQAGRPVRVDHPASIADGLLPSAVGTIPFAVMRGIVVEAVTVSEDEIAAGVRALHQAGLRVEPSGAASFAAFLAGRVRSSGPVVAVASGGNVDPETFRRLAG